MAASSSVAEDGANPTFPRQGVVPISSSPPPSPPPPPPQQDGDNAAPTSMGDDNSQARVGTGNPTPPSHEQRITRTAAAEYGLDRVPPKASVGGGVGLRYNSSGAVVYWAEIISRNKNWTLFVLGNLISAAVVVCEMSQVNGCFDEPLEENADVTENRAGKNTADTDRDTSDRESIRFLVIALLVFGLATEIISAAVLCYTYRSPLDIKSMRKIPPDMIRSCGAASVVVNFLAPFSWGVIYTCGSYVTIQADTFASCGGPDGSGLIMYIVVSGLGMFVVGLGLLVLSVFTLLSSSCGSAARCADKCCCAAVRRGYRRRVLSVAALFDVFWQVQGSVWLYRTGGAGGVGFVVLIVFSVVGGVLAELGSGAPPLESTQELQGGGAAPRPLVLAEQPDAADGI